MIQKCSYCLEKIDIETKDFIQIEIEVEGQPGYMLFHEGECWNAASTTMKFLGMEIPEIKMVEI